MLCLMYITNNERIAQICDRAGVDRVFVDLEKLGKAQRQMNWNSVQSDHSIEDIKRVKSAVEKADVLVRVNPINVNSEKEIGLVIENGADFVMLPYFKTADEVRSFVKYVDGKVKTSILVETKDAVENIDEILAIEGIDEVHIGLNDLSHSYEQSFLFEPFKEGTVDYVVKKIKEYGIKKYGIGGIAKIGYGKIPAEDVICEHYRLGSSCAILSRAFCNTEEITDLDEIEKIFSEEVQKVRRIEKYTEMLDEQLFEYHRKRFNEKIKKVLDEI